MVGSENLDGTSRAGGLGQSPIAGQQGCLQRFSQSHVGGVVDGQVVAKLPTTSQQRQMRDSFHREVVQIGQGKLGSPGFQATTANMQPCVFGWSRSGADLVERITTQTELAIT